MGYRVSATTSSGGGVSIIVSDVSSVLALAEDYREDGFTEINVKDLDGKDIKIEKLAAPTPIADFK